MAALPSTSVVLYEVMFEDAAGAKYRPIDVLKELTAISPVPVISGYDQFIGTGTIGGYMYSIDQQARDATQISLRILHGEAVNNIPILKNQSNRFIFDHIALQHYDIPLSTLPTSSIIKNRQYSTWELYQSQIIAVIVVFMVLLLLVAFLIMMTRRLNSARLSLKRLNIDLETRVQERTIALSQTNHELELEITNRKLVEDELRESEMRFHFLTDTAPVLIWQSGTDELCDYFNKRWLNFTGRTLEQEIGNGWTEGIHPDDYQNFLDTYLEAFKDQREFRMEYRLRRANGEYRSLINNGVPRFTLDGRFLGYIGTCVDISDRKLAEEALSENENRFRSMFESHGAVMLLIEPTTGQILNANYSAEKFYGYPRENLCKMNISDINTLKPEEILAEQKRAVAYECNYFNFQHRLANGNIRRVEEYSSPLNQKGNTILFSLIHDVTERKQAEEALLAAHNELEQRVLERTAELSKSNTALEIASRAKDEFLAIMSHEFRTPLTGILGLAEVLQLPHYGNLSEKQLKAVQTIEKSGYRLNTLLQSILNYSSLQSGQQELQIKSFPLQDICKRSLGKIEKIATDKKQILHFSSLPESILANLDEAGMGIILDNLLSNALKFTPQGGSIDLNVVCLPDLHQVRISIRDTGIGIQEKDLPRLFQPFQQLDSRLSRSYEGAGMGLALVKLLVNLHGGRVEVESTFGQGSLFTVFLPWEP